MDAVDVLHVVNSYFPASTGGTEVYVQTLIAALRAHGVRGAVALPDAGQPYEHKGASVFPFARGSATGIAHAYGAPNGEAAQSFRTLVGQMRPRVVHLHSYTAEISELLLDAAQEIGAKTIVTYHIPAVSCARGTMLHMGQTPCDGRLDVRRCAQCALAARGTPGWMAGAIAAMPEAVSRGLGNIARGRLTPLRLPALIADRNRRFHSLVGKADRVVAVSAWVAEVLRVNSLPEDKIVLCRYGAVLPSERRARHRNADGPMRLGYFGRMASSKGIDIVIDALRLVPDAPVRLDIHGVRSSATGAHEARIEGAAAKDARIALRPPVPHDAVIETMRACDFVVVPSRWLETGPLVALEAFAAGTPVLGSRLGGLPELVRSGVDGLLIAPNEPETWAAAIASLAGDPDTVAKQRAGVRPPRTVEDVAREMAGLYDTVLSEAR